MVGFLSLVMGLVICAFSSTSFAQSCEQFRAQQIAEHYSFCNSLQHCSPDNNNTTTCWAPRMVVSREGQGAWYACWVTITNTGNPQPSELQYGSARFFSNCPSSQKPPEKKSTSNQPGSCQAPSPNQRPGSIISVESQTLGEQIEIVGSPFVLYYHSAYQDGFKKDFKIKMQVTGAEASPYPQTLTAQTKRNGTVVNTATFATGVANQVYSYLWNGLDVTNTNRLPSEKFQLVFTENLGSVNSVETYDLQLSHFDAKQFGLGGWLPNTLKFYDSIGKIMYSGDGTSASVEAKQYGGGNPLYYWVADPSGKYVYIFEANGRHLYTKLGLTGSTVYSHYYDSAGRLSRIDSIFGRQTLFNRNSSGGLTSITAQSGQVTNVTVNANGYLATVTNPNNETHTLTYTGTQGMLRTFKKPNNEISTFTFDAEGMLTKDAHSGGYFTELVRDINSNSTFDISVINPLGRVSRINSNITGIGDVTRYVTDPGGVVAESRFNDYPYYNYSEKSEYSGGESNSWSVKADPRFGWMSPVPSSHYYSGMGTRSTEYTREVTQTTPGAPFGVTQITTSEKISGTNNTVTTVFNASTSKFTTTSFLGKQMETTIDAYERPTTIKFGGLNSIVFTYNSDQLTKVTTGARVTNFTYDTLRRLSTVKNPLNQTTTFGYDNANRVTSKTFPDLRVIGFSYDGSGNLTGVTPPSRPLHSLVLNGHGLLGSYNPPTLSGVSVVNTTYTYNANRELTKITRPDGGYVNFNYYDPSGVLLSYSSPTVTYNVTWDIYNNPTRIEATNGVSTYMNYAGSDMNSYNVTVGGNGIGGYQRSYNSIASVSSDKVLNPSGVESVIDYSYNDDGDLSQAGELLLAYSVPNGQLTGTTFGTGSTGFTDAYTYNAYGELIGYNVNRGTTQVYSVTYGHNTNGQKIKKTQIMNGITNVYDYTYDSSARLSKVAKNSVVVSNYGYDGNSNRNSGNVGAQTTTATYDNQDRLTAYNNFSFTYNANGDLLTKKNNTTNQTTTYTYDVFGNLIKVVIPGGTTIEYEIDGLNRRIGKKVNGVLQKRWIWMDQYRIAAELKANGEIYRRFVYGSKSNVPDYMITPTAKYRIISDYLGSIRMIMSPSGNLVQRMDHDEFGRVIEDTVPAVTPFGFAGGMYDNQTGLVRFGARDYDPETGRWTSKDPTLFGGGDSNLFGYVWNDPINWIDVEGLAGGRPGNVIDNNTLGGGGAGSGGASIGKDGIMEIVKPAGQWIGKVGKNGSNMLRVLQGGMKAAEKMFAQLCQGAQRAANQPANGVRYVHSDGTSVLLRSTSNSGEPTISINIGAGRDIKLKFE